MPANIALQDDILANLGATYELPNGTRIQGQAVSFLKTSLTDVCAKRRWKNLGNLNDFETLCEEQGFKVVSARTVRNGTARQLCRVITL